MLLPLGARRGQLDQALDGWQAGTGLGRNPRTLRRVSMARSTEMDGGAVCYVTHVMHACPIWQ